MGLLHVRDGITLRKAREVGELRRGWTRPALAGPFVPRIEFGGGFARVGNATFALNGRSLFGGTAGALLLGVAPTLQQVAGIELLVDLGSTLVVLPATATGAAGAGTVSRTLPIPNQPGIAGFNLYAYRGRGRNLAVADRR